MELHESDERQRLGRVAVDILRPVPVGKISVRTKTVRPGRRVTLVESVLEADGQEVLHARGWRIERPDGEVPEVTDSSPPPGPLPRAGDGQPPMIFQRRQHGYLASVEWRFLPAGFASVLAESATPRTRAQLRAAWARPRIPLLPGEVPSPMSRALLVADSGSGIGAALPSSRFIFINVDLTVVLPRDPIGEWLLLEASTTVGSDGTGLAVTRLSDSSGAFGSGWQTLLVAPRG